MSTFILTLKTRVAPMKKLGWSATILSRLVHNVQKVLYHCRKPPPYNSEQMAAVFRDTYVDAPFARGQVVCI